MRETAATQAAETTTVRIFINHTYDPEEQYVSFMGYTPGAIMQLSYTLTVQTSLLLGKQNEFASTQDKVICEAMFEKFNIEHPSDYRDRSLSVGDVVSITDTQGTRYYACDIVGFTPITEEQFKTPAKAHWRSR